MTLKEKYHLVYKTATTPFFPACVFVAGFSGRFADLTDNEIKPRKVITIVENGVTMWFFDRELCKISKEIFKDFLDDPSRMEGIKRKEAKLSQDILCEIGDVSSLYANGTLSPAGREKLERIFSTVTQYGRIIDVPGLLFQLYVAEDIQQEIEGLDLPEEKTQEMLHNIFSSHRKTNYERFILAVKDVVAGSRSASDVAEEFYWLTHDYLGDIIDEKYVLGKADEFQEENLDEHLEASDERIEKIEQLVSELPVRLQSKVRITQDLLYLYNERKKEVINQVNIFIRRVVQKRAGTERVSQIKKIYQLTPMEIFTYLEGEDVSYEGRDERWCHEIFDEQIRKGADEYFQLIDERKERTVLRGKPASRGFARGTARIILNVSHMHKFQKGDILVAPFTNVSYLPIMRKAKAILTETGGMTSHAAIVSRELGVPCIVGIEGLLDVLDDGETIEVDATDGTLKRIESGGDDK